MRGNVIVIRILKDREEGSRMYITWKLKSLVEDFVDDFRIDEE